MWQQLLRQRGPLIGWYIALTLGLAGSIWLVGKLLNVAMTSTQAGVFLGLGCFLMFGCLAVVGNDPVSVPVQRRLMVFCWIIAYLWATTSYWTGKSFGNEKGTVPKYKLKYTNKLPSIKPPSLRR
jgi:hypothetical protein